MKKSSIFLVLGLNLSILFITAPIMASEKQISVKVNMENDNPFLNLIPDLFYVDDDAGYTHGLGIEAEYIPEVGKFSENERWKVSLKSGLYTEQQIPDGKTYDDVFPDVPQNINEITELKLTWDNVLNSQSNGKVYYLVGGGVGRVNNSDESGWGSLGQQRRWHAFKNEKLTPETTATYKNLLGETYKTFITANAAMGKVITFDNSMKDCQCEMNRVKLEAGTELISIRQGSRVYAFIGVDKTIVNFGKSSSIGVNLDNTVSIFESGRTELKSEAGIYYKNKKWTVKTGLVKRKGKGNDELFQYIDDDAIWMLSIERTF